MVAGILDRPTLVLNRSWQPVGVAPVSRSLVLLWNDNARVVDPQDYRLYSWADWAELIPREDEPFIQGVRLRLRVPEVVALTNYGVMSYYLADLKMAQQALEEARALRQRLIAEIPTRERDNDDRVFLGNEKLQVVVAVTGVAHLRAIIFSGEF